ncbi:uncharacterized protein N0V89_010723 [Didymosphaeria variabile]|uniref:Uncharacterized protein n=1 Tax=Didymosphaeria variabile TaxID=1932322 RepID=A0A9W9C6E7_9PLEO|nr:uncharacterized protein N0V89_010723 [Didymosphaeria variabile]KAJ4346791.1 hypothetical protein N0V89_010723 [Didymosphaeria variabile]
MSSLTAQESSASQPDLPSNQGTTAQTGPGKDDPSVPFKVGNEATRGLDASTTDKTTYGNNASGTSEARRGEDLSFQQEEEGEGFVGKKTGSESLIDSVEGSVHERGEAEHSRAMG